MAKRKNAVKSAPKSLRQALSAVKTAIIHFSEDHIVAIGYNPTSKETIVSDIPQNLSSQFVLGEESGGGSFNNKKISITIISNLSYMFMWTENYFISENGYVSSGTIEIPENSQIVRDLMIPISIDSPNYYFGLPMINPYTNTVVASDPVNCTFNFSGGEQYLVVTDPTMDASITLTYSLL